MNDYLEFSLQDFINGSGRRKYYYPGLENYWLYRFLFMNQVMYIGMVKKRGNLAKRLGNHTDYATHGFNKGVNKNGSPVRDGSYLLRLLTYAANDSQRELLIKIQAVNPRSVTSLGYEKPSLKLGSELQTAADCEMYMIFCDSPFFNITPHGPVLNLWPPTLVHLITKANGGYLPPFKRSGKIKYNRW